MFFLSAHYWRSNTRAVVARLIALAGRTNRLPEVRRQDLHAIQVALATAPEYPAQVTDATLEDVKHLDHLAKRALAAVGLPLDADTTKPALLSRFLLPRVTCAPDERPTVIAAFAALSELLQGIALEVDLAQPNQPGATIVVYQFGGPLRAARYARSAENVIVSEYAGPRPNPDGVLRSATEPEGATHRRLR
jgi:hypothetical protein